MYNNKKYKQVPTVIPTNGNFELRAPGGKIWTLCPRWKRRQPYPFLPPQFRTNKDESKLCDKREARFHGNGAWKRGVTLAEHQPGLIQLVKHGQSYQTWLSHIVTFWLIITLHNCSYKINDTDRVEIWKCDQATNGRTYKPTHRGGC